jgi:hypothetical protein
VKVKRFEQVAMGQVVEERRKSMRTPSMAIDVVWPAVLIALAVMVLMTSIVSALLAAAQWGSAGSIAAYAALAGAAGGSSAFMLMLARRLENYDERMVSVTAVMENIEQHPAGGNTFFVSVDPGRDLRLPTEPRAGALTEFAQAVVGGQATFSEAGAKVFGYGREAWSDLRDKFLSNDWARWKRENAPQQGIELRSKGWAILRGLAANTPPTLDGDVLVSNGHTYARTHARTE